MTSDIQHGISPCSVHLFYIVRLIYDQKETNTLLLEKDPDLVPVSLESLKSGQIKVACGLCIDKVLAASRAHITPSENLIDGLNADDGLVLVTPRTKTRWWSNNKKRVDLPQVPQAMEDRQHDGRLSAAWHRKICAIFCAKKVDCRFVLVGLQPTSDAML